MKKLLLPVLALMALASCDKEQSRHGITLYYPTAGSVAAVYADQTQDSIVFYTFDSYTATSQSDWITLDSERKSATLPNDYYTMYGISIPVNLQVNTTDSTRIGYVSIYNYGGDWSQTAATGFLQYGWLNITQPSPVYSYLNTIPNKAIFRANLGSGVESTTLAFTVQNYWTISVEDGSFASLETFSGQAGSQTLDVKLTPNTSSEARSTTLTLTSSGVSTPIIITQDAQKN